MARKPAPIPPKAREAWERGDEASASRLAKLMPRQLRNRLGAPGRKPPPPASPEAAGEVPPASPPQRLVKLPPRGSAKGSVNAPVRPSPPPPAPSDSEPTTEQIGRLDTREEAEDIYREVRTRMADGTVECPGCGGAVPVGADPVRFASLAEKGLAALNRIEQIDKRRPAPPTPDAVQEAIRQAMAESTDHLLRHTVPAAERWAKLLPRLRAALGIAAPELLRELDTLTGGATT